MNPPSSALAPLAATPDQARERGDLPDDASQWGALRQTSSAEGLELLDRTFKWLATLSPALRPMATGREFPRIFNRLGDLWPSCEYTRLYFQSLLVDRRQGRRGFPPTVRRELEALQHYYCVNHSGLPAILWNAVPVTAPRIPHRVFPRHPDSGEIDILPP